MCPQQKCCYKPVPTTKLCFKYNKYVILEIYCAVVKNELNGVIGLAGLTLASQPVGAVVDCLTMTTSIWDHLMGCLRKYSQILEGLFGKV